MKRDEIAELVADDARVASNAYPDMEMKVPAAMLAELCRVWLAVDGAPEVELRERSVPCEYSDEPMLVVWTDMTYATQQNLNGTRVRLVPLATAKGNDHG